MDFDATGRILMHTLLSRYFHMRRGAVDGYDSALAAQMCIVAATCVAVVAGVVIIASTVISVGEYVERRSWSEASGTVTGWQVFGTGRRSVVVQLEYDYSVGGLTLHGCADAPSPNVFRHMEDGKDRAKSFKVGAAIKVLYDPKAPERSALSVSPQDGAVTGNVGAAVLWLAWLGGLHGFRQAARGSRVARKG